MRRRAALHEAAAVVWYRELLVRKRPLAICPLHLRSTSLSCILAALLWAACRTSAPAFRHMLRSHGFCGSHLVLNKVIHGFNKHHRDLMLCREHFTWNHLLAETI